MVLTPDDPRRLARVGGQFDEHLRQIERQLGIRINSRGNRFELAGSDSAAARGRRVLEDLFDLAETEELDAERVHLALAEHMRADSRDDGADGGLVINTRRRAVRARGPHQIAYTKAMRETRPDVRHRACGHRQDVSRRRRGRRGARERFRAPHRAGAPGRRSRRAARLSARRPDAKSRSVLAARCTTRSTR